MINPTILECCTWLLRGIQTASSRIWTISLSLSLYIYIYIYVCVCLCVCVCVYIYHTTYHWIPTKVNMPILRCTTITNAPWATLSLSIYIYIYIKLATVVEGDPKAPFSIATTSGVMRAFLGLLNFALDTYLIMLSVRQGGIKYYTYIYICFVSLFFFSLTKKHRVGKNFPEYLLSVSSAFGYSLDNDKQTNK